MQSDDRKNYSVAGGRADCSESAIHMEINSGVFEAEYIIFPPRFITHVESIVENTCSIGANAG